MWSTHSRLLTFLMNYLSFNICQGKYQLNMIRWAQELSLIGTNCLGLSFFICKSPCICIIESTLVSIFLYWSLFLWHFECSVLIAQRRDTEKRNTKSTNINLIMRWDQQIYFCPFLCIPRCRSIKQFSFSSLSRTRCDVPFLHELTSVKNFDILLRKGNRVVHKRTYII